MVDLAQVKRLIALVNSARWPELFGEVSEKQDAVIAEQRLQLLFNISETLVVYGTLAPGRPNYHIVAPYGGIWTDGVITGDLTTGGWGSALGYPAFQPREDGAAVAAKVLRSALLRDAWDAIDQFEGPQYQRILVPVFDTAAELVAVGNLYACY